MGQLAATIGEREKGKFPSQPKVNPKDQNPNPSQQAHQVNLLNDLQIDIINSIIALGSGKHVNIHVVMPDLTQNDPPSNASSNDQSIPGQSKEPLVSESSRPIQSKAPFPNRLRSKKTTNMDKVRQIFEQVRVNIPLLDVIQQVPTYAKYLKDLCTQKKTAQVPNKAFLTANVSSILTSLMPTN